MLCAVLSSVFASHRGGDGLPCMLVCIVLSGRSPACARVRRGRVRAGPVFRALGVSLFGTDSTLSYRKSVMYRCVMVKIEFLPPVPYSRTARRAQASDLECGNR